MVAGVTHVVVGVHLHDDVDGLRRSLPTVVHQRFAGSLEVVVVDDGAGDEARRVLDELTAWYPAVTVLRNGARKGRAAARNQVLDLAGEAAVAWLDLGDVWHPRKLASQQAALLAADDPDATLVTCSHRRVDLGDASEDVVTPDVSRDVLERLLARELPVPVGTLLGTADAHRLVGAFDADLPYRDDEEFLLRFLAGGGRIASPGGAALSTGSVVRDHPTAREVAAAERRIRRRHGRMIRRRDPSSVRRAHRRELQRVSRLQRKEGHAMRSVLYRSRADLVAAVDRLARATGRGDPAQKPIEAPSPRDRPPLPSTGDPGTGVEPRAEFVEVHRAADAGDWDGAFAAWSILDTELRADADPITFEVVARCLRALGRYLEALEIAADGLTTWPGHPRIELELAKSRAATTDWSAALRPAGRPATVQAAPGSVSSLGVLAGGEGFVTGQLTARSSALPVEVALRVDDLTIVTTYARATDATRATALEFSLSCEQLREFLGDGDTITVAADGQPLPLEGYGAAAEVRTGYPSRLPALRERLDGGAIFTKFGRLRPGYTPARKRRTMELVDRVAEAVEAAHGYVCTPFYGNLLGAVREQDFIAHDVGGFDVGYLSRHHEPAAVRAEFADLCRRLLDLGYHLELEPFGAMIRRAAGDRIFVDLNYAWMTPDGHLQLSYGWRHEPARDRQRFEAPRDTYLACRLVPIPGDAEAVLSQVYGAGWATPDQGFDLTHGLQRDEAFLLADAELEALRALAPERVTVLPRGER